MTLHHFSAIGEKLRHISAPKLKNVNDYLFYGCKNLRIVNLPEAKTIGKKAFEWCENLIRVAAPNVKVISEEAFGHCDHLTFFSFKSLKEVKRLAFFMTNLSEIEFLHPVRIEEKAFAYMPKLEKVKLNSLEEVSPLAFVCCTRINEIRAENDTDDDFEFDCIDSPEYAIYVGNEKKSYICCSDGQYQYCQKFRKDAGNVYVLYDGGYFVWLDKAIVYKGEVKNKIMFNDIASAINVMRAS